MSFGCKKIAYWKYIQKKDLENSQNKEQIICIVFTYELKANIELTTEE